MNMLKQAYILWKKERKRGSTLERRLILFFISISVSLILVLTLLMSVFGITGRDEIAIKNYMENELQGISRTISDDFGRLSVAGINLAEDISKNCDVFFQENNISVAELSRHKELVESLLQRQMTSLLNTANSQSCGGVFILLDATVRTAEKKDENPKAGIFIKKTQPTSTSLVGVKLHYLRGPAQIARENGIGLIAQWKMEYNIEGEEFFSEVMDVARKNPELPLSRLYYWSGRITLEGNSEAGFLLCIPLRSSNGEVFGVCGIEVSDRMFKSLYSPDARVYEKVFAVAAPSDDKEIQTSRGMIAGNYYLTGSRLSEDLILQRKGGHFSYYSVNENSYGGKAASLRMYPKGSPYEEQGWTVAVLMSTDLLNSFIKGSFPYFIWIVVVLLCISFAVSVGISRHYLRPVTEALDSIRNHSYGERKKERYLEINDLFEFLEKKEREHEEVLQQQNREYEEVLQQQNREYEEVLQQQNREHKEVLKRLDKEHEEELQQLEREHEEMLRQLDREKQNVQSNYDRAQTWITHLADERMPEVDSDSYEYFLQCLHMLTPKEREIFDYYLDGKSAKEIVDLVGISQNTLKYHNKNIYSKLGVSSRKQLLEYAALMKCTMKEDRTCTKPV